MRVSSRTFLTVLARSFSNARRHRLPFDEIDNAAHHGVDLAETVQGFAGPFGQFDGLLIAEQAIDEAFKLFRAHPAHAPKVVRVTLGGYPSQTERLGCRLMFRQFVPEAHQSLEQLVGGLCVVELGQLATPKTPYSSEGGRIEIGRCDIAEEACTHDMKRNRTCVTLQ